MRVAHAKYDKPWLDIDKTTIKKESQRFNTGQERANSTKEKEHHENTC